MSTFWEIYMEELKQAIFLMAWICIGTGFLWWSRKWGTKEDKK